MSFLITHQSPELGSRSVDAVLPASLPEHYVATEKRQVDAGVAGGFHVGPLVSRPVFVVAHREKHPVLQKLGAAPVRIDSREVAHVIAVRLDPPHHRVLSVEKPIMRSASRARVERAIVTDLIGAPVRRPYV